MEILFCSATCCPGLLGGAEVEVAEEVAVVVVMPRGGDRAPRASFSRNTSLDNSVICANTQTRVWLPGSSGAPGSPHLPVLLLDQALGLLDVLVELLDVAGPGL